MKKKTLVEELNIMIFNAFDEKSIQLFDGRPYRDYPINTDDIANLKILLNIPMDFRNFMRQV